MDNRKYEKGLSIFRDLINFSKTILIKNEKKAMLAETKESNIRASHYIAVLGDGFIMSDVDKIKYSNRAIIDGYSLYVNDPNNVFIKLNDDERNGYAGVRYVADWFNRISSETYLNNTTIYSDKIYVKENGYYKPIDKYVASEYEYIYIKRTSGGIYRVATYAESLTYDDIYKIDTYNKYNKATCDAIFNHTTNDLLYTDYVIRNGYEIYTASIDTVYLEIYDVATALYYKEANIGMFDYVPLQTLYDLKMSDTRVFKYDGVNYTLIDKYEATLEPTINYNYIKPYTSIIADNTPYYKSHEIILDISNNVTLKDYYRNIIINEYEAIYETYDDGKIKCEIYKNNNTIQLAYDRSTLELYYVSGNISTYDNIKAYKLDTVCDKCFTPYVEEYNNLGVKEYVCHNCGNILTTFDHISFKYNYMLVGHSILTGDIELINYCSLDELTHKSILNGFKINSKVIMFKENKYNIYRETNEYYKMMWLRGAELTKLRTYSDKYIVHYDNSILNSAELNRFLTAYYQTMRYFMTTMYDKAFEMYSNYDDLVNYLIIISAILKYIDLDNKFEYKAEFMTERDLKNILYSHGITTFNNIPKIYQIDIIRNLQFLIKTRGTTDVITRILSVFNVTSLNVFKYILVKDYKRDNAGNIIKPAIFTYDKLDNIIREKEHVSLDPIPVLETILMDRVSDNRYDVYDTNVLKTRIKKYFRDNILSYIYDNALQNVNMIANLKKYVETNFGVPANAIYDEAYIKTIANKLDEYINNKITDMSGDQLITLFMDYGDKLNGYTYKDIYDDVITDIYVNDKVDMYTNMGVFNAIALSDSIDSEKSAMTNIIAEEKLVDETVLDNLRNDYNDLEDYVYDRDIQLKFLIISILYNEYNIIKNMRYNELKTYFINRGFDRVDIPNKNLNDNTTNILNDLKDKLLSLTYRKFNDDRFNINISTDFNTWVNYSNIGDVNSICDKITITIDGVVV